MLEPVLIVVVMLIGLALMAAGAYLEARDQDRTTGEPPGRTRTGE